MLTGLKNYILENPNALQIASTIIIGVIAYAIWSFTSRTPPTQ
jgi:hypothetical protein